MTRAKKFFERPQNAAVLKHGILRRYLKVFAQKLGSTHDDVIYLDGFAGPGKYKDGSPGSPAVALEVARSVEATKSSTTVSGIFVEDDRDNVLTLRAYLEGEGVDWPVHRGAVQDHLGEIVDGLPAGAALFAFFDPFGLGIPFRDLKRRVLERPAKTEVLLNYSLSGVRRSAGHLTSEKEYPAKQAFVGRLDRTMGGTWWQPIWESGDEDREEQILDKYFRRLAKLGWSVWQVPVSDRWLGPDAYALLHLTQHPDGHWQFAQALSMALEEYREACHVNAGQIDFESPEDRKQRLIDEIYATVEPQLAAGKLLTVQSQLKDVCGPALAFARETHIRAAIKRLYKEGKTSTTGIGQVQWMVIKP